MGLPDVEGSRCPPDGDLYARERGKDREKGREREQRETDLEGEIVTETET